MPEMMSGTREEFEYIECARCGCVQIAEIPVDVGQHYPGHYYSLSHNVPLRVVRAAKRARARHALGDHSVLGALLSRLLGTPSFVEWSRRAGVDRSSAILDVGAGGGHLLSRMADAGFEQIRGIDPFIAGTSVPPDRIAVEKATIDETDGEFDLVMFHHSFEHIPDQEGTLRRAANLVRPGGCILIRIPVVGGYAWRTYGSHWVQLDAPRHLYLHSEQSLAILASRIGLVVEAVVHDSTAFQFWGSELYQRGTSLNDRRFKRVESLVRLLSPRERVRTRRASTLNAAHDGDQAAFYLRRGPTGRGDPS